MKIYLVEDTCHAPGRIYAIFTNEADAALFADAIEDQTGGCSVVERTLFYGQPPIRGYNE